MNKEIFLGELRGYLQILEDQEQEDILEEYAQHIDIKIQKGLSEEEAIRDFGSVKELASGILEAYHVKPGYQGEKARSRLPEVTKEKAAEGKKLLGRMGRFLKEKCEACARWIFNGYRWLRRKCRAGVRWFRRLPSGKTQKDRSEEKEKGKSVIMESRMTEDGGAAFVKDPEAVVQSGEQRRGDFWRTLSHGIAVLWKTCVNLCVWWLRLFWNLTWLMFSVLCGILAAMMLAGVGGTVVLLFQGYPFIGILLLSQGSLLCFGALSCGAYSLMVRREKKEPAKAESEKTEPEETDSEAEGMNLEKTEDMEKEFQEEVRHE